MSNQSRGERPSTFPETRRAAGRNAQVCRFLGVVVVVVVVGVVVVVVVVVVEIEARNWSTIGLTAGQPPTDWS